MKTIKLSRVSTPEQKKSNLSLPAQGHRLDKYAIAHNLEDWKEFEIDETAWKTDRKKFGQVIELLQKSKEPIALVCDKIDRLIRNFNKNLAILEELRLAGKLELHFPSDNIILHKNSPAAELRKKSMTPCLKNISEYRPTLCCRWNNIAKPTKTTMLRLASC